MSDRPEKTRRQEELDHLHDLPRANYDLKRPNGVLLSDQIKFYVDYFKMIDPFYEGNLKRAGYELSVGEQYSLGGRTHPLNEETGQNELQIPPFEVAIIQTHERVNLPDFLIARWNIRVKWAYKGLLWVGGPQVDPGYQGFLFCPIYNLSDRPVTLHHGDALALMDFVTTTPPHAAKPYPKPENRTRLLFEDYLPDELQSALATQTRRDIRKFSQSLGQIRAQVDNYARLTFVVVALMFSALAITHSKPPEVAIWNPIILLAALALICSLAAWHASESSKQYIREYADYSPPGRKSDWRVWLQIGTIVLLATVATVQHLFYKSLDEAVVDLQSSADGAEARGRHLEKEIRRLNEEVSSLRGTNRREPAPARKR